MIGPRGSGPRNVARELLPERAVPGERISSFDIAITWVTRATGASCVMAPRRRLSRRHRLINCLMRQPGRDRPGNKAHQAVENELGDAAVWPPRAVEQFGGDEWGHADNAHPEPRGN